MGFGGVHLQVIENTPEVSTTWWCARSAPAIRCAHRPAAHLVQVLRVSLARSHRASRWSCASLDSSPRVRRSPRLGQQLQRFATWSFQSAHGTEGWTEEQLATLVTRDSMIGVARALEPAGV